MENDKPNEDNLVQLTAEGKIGILQGRFNERSDLLRTLFEEAKIKNYYEFGTDDAFRSAHQKYQTYNKELNTEINDDHKFDSLSVNQIHSIVLGRAANISPKRKKEDVNLLRSLRVVPSEEDRRSPSEYPEMKEILQKPIAYRSANKIILDDS